MITPRPIILISSCKRDQENGNNQAIRNTWGAHSVIPYRFFVGDTSPEHDDEIMLDCPDNYFSLPMKTQLSLRWAMLEGYTHFFRAFTDTFIDTERLAKSGFEEHLYSGNPCGFWRDLFHHGGPGYWLNLNAAQLVITQPHAHAEKLEDYWVGMLMQKYGVPPHHDFRYSMGLSYGRRERPSLPDNDIISEHLSDSGNKYDNKTMYDRHKLRYPNSDLDHLTRQ